MQTVHPVNCTFATARSVQLANAPSLDSFGHTASLVKVGGTQFVVVVGGGSSQTSVLPAALNLHALQVPSDPSFENSTWTSRPMRMLAGSVPESRVFHSAVVHDNMIVMFGGRSSDGFSLADCWTLQIKEQEPDGSMLVSWTKRPLVGSSIAPVSGHTSVLVNFRMINIGGHTGGSAGRRGFSWISANGWTFNVPSKAAVTGAAPVAPFHAAVASDPVSAPTVPPCIAQ